MKYCPNCGAKIAPDDKFCTKCGFVLPVEGQASGAAKQVRPVQSSQPQAAPTSTPVQPNQTVTAVQGYATNYFQWLWDALKKPFNNDESAGQYFGLINFAIIILLNAFSFNTVIQRVEQMGSSMLGAFGASTQSAVKSSFWMQFIFVGLVIYAIFVGVSYCFSHYATHNLDRTFLGYTNRLAHYTSSILVLAVVQFLDSFAVNSTNGVGFYTILVVLQLFILLSGCLLSVAPQQGVTGSFDSAYTAILTTVVINVLLFIVADIAAQSALSSLMSLLKQF